MTFFNIKVVYKKTIILFINNLNFNNFKNIR